MSPAPPSRPFNKLVRIALLGSAAYITSGLLDRRALFPLQATDGCSLALTAGAVASLATQHPLPFAASWSACLPPASAQQKIGSEFQVNTFTTSLQWRSSTAALPNGDFVVVWDSSAQDGHATGVFGQLFDSNATRIGNEFQVNTYTTLYQDSASIATLSSGNFVVTWQSDGQDGNDFGIYGQLFDGTATKIGSELQVNTYSFGAQVSPSVAVLTNQNFIVTWASNRNIYGQLFDSSGTKVGGEFPVCTFATYDYRPSVAALVNDNFVVTWDNEGQDGSSYGIYGQLFDGNATKIGSEFQVNTYTNLAQKWPSIAVLLNGNFVVTWESEGQDGNGYGIYGQLFDGNAIRIGNEFNINTYRINDQRLPSIATLASGNFVVTWQSDLQDGSNLGVFGQLFDVSTVRVGNEFQINTYTVLHQEDPSVAALPNGNFIVTWTDYAQDGDSYGVFGQLFADGVPFTTGTSGTSGSTGTSGSSGTTGTTAIQGVTTNALTSSGSVSTSGSSTTAFPVVVSTGDSLASRIASSESGSEVVLIAVAIVAGVCVVIGIVGGAYLYRRRRGDDEVVELETIADGEYNNVSAVNSSGLEYHNAAQVKPEQEPYHNATSVQPEEPYHNVRG